MKYAIQNCYQDSGWETVAWDNDIFQAVGAALVFSSLEPFSYGMTRVVSDRQVVITFSAGNSNFTRFFLALLSK